MIVKRAKSLLMVRILTRFLVKPSGIIWDCLTRPLLIYGTIASNVSLNDPSITREIVEKALKDVGAEKVFTNLENGYDEPVIEKGSTLSSGQRQLISFARALAFNPAILIPMKLRQVLIQRRRHLSKKHWMS